MEVFDAAFAYHLFLSALPFAVVLGVVALIHFTPRRRQPAPETAP